MKGRKPKDNAIRRGVKDSYGLQAREERRGVAMPADVALDPVKSEIWQWVAPEDNSFSDSDIPALKILVGWVAIFFQAQQSMSNPDGSVDIFDRIGSKPFKDDDDKAIPLVRTHPAINIMKQASSEIRAYSDMLGLSPLARSRIGLMDATTVKTAADTAAMFRSIDAAYGLPTEVENVSD